MFAETSSALADTLMFKLSLMHTYSRIKMSFHLQSKESCFNKSSWPEAIIKSTAPSAKSLLFPASSREKSQQQRRGNPSAHQFRANELNLYLFIFLHTVFFCFLRRKSMNKFDRKRKQAPIAEKHEYLLQFTIVISLHNIFGLSNIIYSACGKVHGWCNKTKGGRTRVVAGRVFHE